MSEDAVGLTGRGAALESIAYQIRDVLDVMAAVARVL